MRRATLSATMTAEASERRSWPHRLRWLLSTAETVFWGVTFSIPDLSPSIGGDGVADRSCIPTICG